MSNWISETKLNLKLKSKLVYRNTNNKYYIFYYSFKDILHINEGCVLQYESKYEKIVIQNRRANKDWQDLSESSTQTNIFPNATEVEVDDLVVDKVYDFRGLFEDKTNGEIVQLNSKEKIKIKSNNNW